MKTRQGFVSNSSSSSFIVAFPHKPSSVEELKKMMFTDEKSIEYYSEPISTDKIVEQVWNDITSEARHSEDNLQSEDHLRDLFEDLYWMYAYRMSRSNPLNPFIGGDENTFIFRDEKLGDKFLKLFNEKEEFYRSNRSGEVDWKKYHEYEAKLQKISAKAFKIDYKYLMENEWKNKYIRVFSYSDNDGSFFCTMEHGDIFRNLDSIRISQH